MGHGDFKLLTALGASCMKGILPIILMSSVLGALIGSIWLYSRGRPGDADSLRPHLALAGWLFFMG
ncbi:hypothetical protein QT383_19615 [Stenotrophomonas rhizophila]